jgi:hypothetical protein
MCYNHLRKEPELSDNLIVAMLANSAVETGGTFNYRERQKGRLCPAIGLFQMDPRGAGLWKLYLEYLDYRKEEDSAEVQLDMVTDIMLRVWQTGVTYVGSGNVTKVLQAAKKGPLEATKALSDHFLRPGKPHMERRIKAAEEMLAFIENEKNKA